MKLTAAALFDRLIYSESFGKERYGDVIGVKKTGRGVFEYLHLLRCNSIGSNQSGHRQPSWLPTSYHEIYENYDGYSLFNNVIHMYGWNTTFTRNISSIEFWSPISISEANLQSNESGEFIIGAFAGYDEKFDIAVLITGECILRNRSGHIITRMSFERLVFSSIIKLIELSQNKEIDDDVVLAFESSINDGTIWVDDFLLN